MADLKRHVIVVGAGLTGLTAAWRLRALGHTVSIHEMSAVAGGRTRTVRQDGFVFDVGAITMLPTYQQTLALIDETGLGPHLHKISPVIGIPRGGKIHALDVSRPIRSLLTTGLVSTRAKLRLLGLLRPMLAVWGIADFRSLVPLARWDSETIDSFASRELGEEIRQFIAGPIIRGNTLNSTADAPLGELLWMVRQYAAPYLYGLDQGINSLAEALADRLPVAFGSTITGVVESGEEVVVSGHGANGPFEEKGAACVLALPPAGILALAPNLTSGQRHFLSTIRPLPSVSLHLGLRTVPDIAQTFILPPECEEPNLTTIVMDHLKAPGRAPAGKGVISLFCRDSWAAAHMDQCDDQIRDRILAMARPFLGDLSSVIETSIVQRWPYAIIKSEVGLYRKMQGYETGLDPQSPVQLAGDFLSMGMEAAVISGNRAAGRVGARLAALLA